MAGGNDESDGTFLTDVMFKGKAPTNTKPSFKRPSSSQRAGTVTKNKKPESEDELEDDLDSEYRDQVFDFDAGQNLINRAENWLDNKKNNFDNVSMSSGKTS
jgi:hypothetical protein